MFNNKAINGAGAQAFDCKRKNLWIGLLLEEMKYLMFLSLVSRQSQELRVGTQRTMRPEFGGKWEVECLSTRLPLSTLLHAGYSV